MIKLENISKSFPNKKVLKNLNLNINKNEITFIVGPSGSGKTTLLNIIGGLDFATQGKILIDDNSQIFDTTSNLTKFRAEKIGFIFQDYNLIPGLSVMKNIELGLMYSNKKIDKDLIFEKIKSLNLDEATQSVETLSGGEKQRVAIIRALLKDASVILADEPTGNLDSTNSDAVFEILRELKKDKYVIIVSHDTERAQKYADRIIDLKDGEIIKDEKKKIVDARCSTEDIIKGELKANNYSKNFLKSIFMLGFNSIKRKFSRIISIALVLALSISAMTIVADLNRYGEEISNNVNINYLETDLVSIYSKQEPNIELGKKPFYEEDINNIREQYEANEIVSTYNYFYKMLFSKEFLTIDANIRQIEINQFFKTRVLANDIEGRFIESDNEIILAEDVANELFGGNCLNKTIALNNGFGQAIEYIIVGINKTVNAKDEMYSYVSSSSIKTLYEKYLTEQLINILMVTKVRNEVLGVSTGGLKTKIKELTNPQELNILYGSLPVNDNEVLLSHSEFIRLFSLFELEQNYKVEDLINKSIPIDKVNEIFSKNLCYYYNDLYIINIVGVYENVDSEIILLKSQIDKMLIAYPNMIELYLKDVKKSDDFVKLISDNTDYIASSNYKNLRDNIANQTNFFEFALLIIAIIMALLSLLMINSYSKITILERKDEIAIIKSLGASNRNVGCLIIFDFLFIILFSFILSIIITLIYNALSPTIFSQFDYLNTNFPIALLSIITLFYLLLISIYGLLGLRGLIRKSPAELLKN